MGTGSRGGLEFRVCPLCRFSSLFQPAARRERATARCCHGLLPSAPSHRPAGVFQPLRCCAPDSQGRLTCRPSTGPPRCATPAPNGCAGAPQTPSHRGASVAGNGGLKCSLLLSCPDLAGGGSTPLGPCGPSAQVRLGNGPLTEAHVFLSRDSQLRPKSSGTRSLPADSHQDPMPPACASRSCTLGVSGASGATPAGSTWVSVRLRARALPGALHPGHWHPFALSGSVSRPDSGGRLWLLVLWLCAVVLAVTLASYLCFAR